MKRDQDGARRTVFTPIGTQARVEAVVRRLGDAIELGLLADGEQLPGEQELAAQLGVSTVTLREALMALRQRGLVTTRRGRGGGSFVTVPEGPVGERLLAHLGSWSLEELRELGDYWTAVSGAAARLAAQRTAPDDLRQLHRSVAELEAATDAPARSRLYFRFHVELAAAAQSARLTRELVGVHSEAGALLCLVLAEERHLKDVCDRHRAVICAVQDDAAEQARALVEECVQVSMGRLVELRLGTSGPAGGPQTKEGNRGQQSSSKSPIRTRKGRNTPR
ncbi:FadR/GntR family transcriptional regulator [Streptomyces sp. WMMB 322]|uniref:FadR/GntR family transcriptional regulator n=1 Tax=Streptomyces sp. WMMB 322 TaxID=1286821 RepID=UPI000823C303|nr:GntR family transcriptional regulator [Streptomyces sp. WMMB 322]SCK48925.1 transcriptional regulator, GntR family [Streptomyces sp. WMMB 322]